MFKFLLAAGAAALAMTPALAEKEGKGQGGGGKGNRGEMQARGGDNGKGQGANKGGSRDRVMINANDRGQKAFRADKGNRGNFERGESRGVRYTERKEKRNDRVVVRNDRYDDGNFRRIASNGLIDGCPPGLAKKNNGCLPPGQAKKIVGRVLPAAYAGAMLSGPYASWYRDDDQYLYRVSGNDIYRVNRGTNLIDALIPFGGNDFNYYPVGMNYPADYNYYNVPTQYRNYYPDGGDYGYRFGNNAIYSVDPTSSAIQGIVALLAGDLGVGQRLPSNYGVYNVPMSYREQYYDSADNMYRYNDGYIYRVDPKTQLITSVINALI